MEQSFHDGFFHAAAQINVASFILSPKSQSPRDFWTIGNAQFQNKQHGKRTYHYAMAVLSSRAVPSGTVSRTTICPGQCRFTLFSSLTYKGCAHTVMRRRSLSSRAVPSDTVSRTLICLGQCRLTPFSSLITHRDCAHTAMRRRTFFSPRAVPSSLYLTQSSTQVSVDPPQSAQ